LSSKRTLEVTRDAERAPLPDAVGPMLWFAMAVGLFFAICQT
jgi:hypothetical protein